MVPVRDAIRISRFHKRRTALDGKASVAPARIGTAVRGAAATSGIVHPLSNPRKWAALVAAWLVLGWVSRGWHSGIDADAIASHLRNDRLLRRHPAPAADMNDRDEGSAVPLRLR